MTNNYSQEKMRNIERLRYYAWVHKPESDRAIEDKRLFGLIKSSYSASDGIYGSPRVFKDLREAGERCGHHRVARIMRERKIRAIRGYKSPRLYLVALRL